MPTISERLLKIASFINKGERVADIGTDHAYLPIYLRQSGISPFVLACDIKEKPLSVAKKNVLLSETDGIDFILCDGLSGVSLSEVDTIVIAGMGGELISNILDFSDIRGSGKHLILQPMNSPEILREFLCKNGFTFLNEEAIIDTDRVYTIIDVVASAEKADRDEAFYFTGLLDAKKETDRLYLEKQLERLSSCASMLEKTDNSEQFLYYKNAARYISDYIEV